MPTPGNAATTALFFLGLFVVLYVVFLRPSARPPSVGDEVVTDAGFVGQLREVRGDDAVVELATQVRLTCKLSSLRRS